MAAHYQPAYHVKYYYHKTRKSFLEVQAVNGSEYEYTNRLGALRHNQ